MAKKEQNLGVFVIKHPSGMLETDKGEKSFQGNLGDTLIRGIDGKCYIKAKGSKLPSEETITIADAAVLGNEAE